MIIIKFIILIRSAILLFNFFGMSGRVTYLSGFLEF